MMDCPICGEEIIDQPVLYRGDEAHEACRDAAEYADASTWDGITGQVAIRQRWVPGAVGPVTITLWPCRERGAYYADPCAHAVSPSGGHGGAVGTLFCPMNVDGSPDLAALAVVELKYEEA